MSSGPEPGAAVFSPRGEVGEVHVAQAIRSCKGEVRSCIVDCAFCFSWFAIRFMDLPIPRSAAMTSASGPVESRLAQIIRSCALADLV